jgi:hypothetical protein
VRVSEDLDLLAAQQEAARIAARTQVRDVRLFGTSAELGRFPGEAVRLRWSLDTDVEVERDEDDGNSFVLRSKYSLRIVQVPTAAAIREDEEADSAEGEDDLVADIKFEFGALFSTTLRDGDEAITDEELRAYSLTMGVFAMYPYARQYIYDITGRMGLPPLTVGVLTLPVKREV